MIEKTFSAATQYSAPVFLGKDQRLAISISGTFVGTVDIQRIVRGASNNMDYPAPGDTGWKTVDSYASPFEEIVADGDNCWYRAYCSAYTSGSPVAKLKAV